MAGGCWFERKYGVDGWLRSGSIDQDSHGLDFGRGRLFLYLNWHREVKVARILIIDDNEMFGKMLQEILGRAGYETVFSSMPIVSTQEALTESYDLITLDLSMPDFEGGEVARLFRDMNLQTPVLVVSGYLTDLIEESLAEVGLQNFLRKPFSQEEVLSKIETILQTS